MPKILIVTPHYPPRRLGGTELRARKLANWLRSQGISVEVVCVEEVRPGSSDGLTPEQDLYEGVPVHRLHLTQTRSLTAFRQSYDHPGVEAYLGDVVTGQRPDVIHLISGYLVTACALRVGRKHDIPTVVTLTDYWFICPRIKLVRSNGRLCGGPYHALDCTRCLLSESRRYRLPEQVLPGAADLAWRLLSRFEGLTGRIPLYQEVARRERLLVEALNQATAVTIPTNSLRARLVRAGARDRFSLSRHSIVPEDLGIQPGAVKSKSRLLRFGYLGQILSAKGVDLLLTAFGILAAEHEQVSLTLWGATDDRSKYLAQLEEQLRQIPRSEMKGRYEPTQIGEIMRDIDVLVVPSRWPEIGPFTILEAFATGTPVIAARIGNMPELVQHGVNGLLFEPDTVFDLYTQMRRVVDEPGLYQRLERGILPVRTQEDEMAEVVAIYSQVVDGALAGAGEQISEP